MTTITKFDVFLHWNNYDTCRYKKYASEMQYALDESYYNEWICDEYRDRIFAFDDDSIQSLMLSFWREAVYLVRDRRMSVKEAFQYILEEFIY